MISVRPNKAQVWFRHTLKEQPSSDACNAVMCSNGSGRTMGACEVGSAGMRLAAEPLAAGGRLPADLGWAAKGEW